MGSRKTDDSGTMRGLAVPLAEWTWQNLDKAESSYTESGQLPGSALASSGSSRLGPVISGDQGQDIDIRVARAGLARTSTSRSGGMAVRIDGEADALWRGWQGYGWVNRYSAVSDWSTSTAAEDFDIAPTSDGGVIFVYAEGSNLRSRTLSTGWSLGTEQTVTSAHSRDATVTALPDGRLIAITQESSVFTSYYSDDDGSTWATYDSDPFGQNANISDNYLTGTVLDKARWRSTADGQVLYCRVSTPASRGLTQYASPALGTSLENVGTWTSSPPADFEIMVSQSGKIAIAYTDNSTGALYCRVVSSPWESIASATAVQISGSAYTSACIFEDPTGRWYVTATQGATLKMFASDDGGLTWVDNSSAEYRYNGAAFYTGDASTLITKHAAWPMAGSVVVGFNSTDGGGGGTVYDDVLRYMGLGGWTNVEQDLLYTPGSSGFLAYHWLPIELPKTVGSWSQTTSGTNSDLLQNGRLEITTSTGTNYVTDSSIGSLDTDISVFAEIEVSSGGSLTSTLIGFEIDIDDGVTSKWRLELNATTTGFRVIDVVAASNVADITIDMTTKLQIMVEIIRGTGTIHTASVWYRRSTAVTWTSAGSANLTSTTFGGGTKIQWGNVDSGSGVGYWYQFHWARNYVGASGALGARSAVADLNGRPMTLEPFPLSGDFDGDTGPAYISVRGAGTYAESFDVDRRYTYPASAAFSDVSPSPDRKWRSVNDDSDVTFVWDNTNATAADTLLGPGATPFLAVMGANFKTAYLEGWDGSAWASVVTLNLDTGFGSLDFARTGDVLDPSTTQTSNSDAQRYIWSGELVGGTADISGSYRRIRRNSEGFWISSGSITQRRPRIWFDGYTGAEPSASAPVTDSMTLWAPNGLAYINRSTNTAYDKWRVRIPSQATADGYFEAGVISIGYIQPIGQGWARGMTEDRAATAFDLDDEYGTTWRRQDGPVRRVWRWQWTDAHDITKLQDGNMDEDYLAGTTGEPLATWRDVSELLRGTWEYIKSGEVPVFGLRLIESVATSSVTVTDPTQFLYGRITSIGDRQHVNGKENADEVVRNGTVVIEGIR